MRRAIIKNEGKNNSQDQGSQCPFCGKEIKFSENSAIDSERDPDVFFTTCAECGGSIIVSMVENFFGSAMLAAATDLSADDLIKFSKADEISQDEAIDLYALSKNSCRTAERS